MPGILLFCGRYQPPFDEGRKLVVHHLHERLARLIEVRMVTFGAEPSDGVTVVPSGPLGVVRGLRQLCRAIRPRVVLYAPDAYLDRETEVRIGILRLGVGRTPIAMLALQPNIFDLPTRLMLRLWKPDMILAQTERDAAVCARHGIAYETLPPAVDAEKFRPVGGAEEKRALRRKYGLPEDGRLCLHVGHIRRNRNIEQLVRLDLPADARLLVVGSRSRALEENLKQVLIDRGAAVLDSFVEHIEDLYRLADLYLFPVEGNYAAIEVPLSVLEAMACNLPVVTTPFGELVRLFGNVPGMRFAATAENFQQAVMLALNDPSAETRAAVKPYDWDGLATAVWERLRRYA